MRRYELIANLVFVFQVVAAIAVAGLPAAQSGDGSSTPAQGPTQHAKYGMILRAQGGGFRGVLGTMTVPADWPGQQRVRVVEREIPPGATVTYKIVEDAGRQMIIRVPMLPAGRETKVAVTFEIELLPGLPVPEDTERFTVPDRAGLGRKMATYLAPSPHIESDAPELLKTAEEVVGSQAGAWAKVQAIEQWVFTNIKYQDNRGKRQGVPETLSAQAGDCDEKNSLAVALCRACRIPARLVRVPRHCCYEFYLLDGEGKGHWIFADASARGTIAPNTPVGPVILQKGDNFEIIDPATKRRVKDRFLADTVTGVPTVRGAQLRLELISPATGGRAP